MGPGSDPLRSELRGSPAERIAERIVIARIGGPEVLRLDRFSPSPPAGSEIAIDVAAAGVNAADVFCRVGLYEAAPPCPFAPGFEVSGIVAGVGRDVSGFQVGDRVLAVTRFGGYATALTTGAAWVRKLPTGWSFEEGAALPVAYLTAYHGLVNLGRLTAGETVVVQTAAGGVGTAACQIATALGARVIGTVGSEAKRDVALAAGAGDVVVSSRYRVWDEIRSLVGKAGVDVVFDGVGGQGLRHAFEALNPGGRLLTYGFSEMIPRHKWRNWPLLVWRYLRTPRFSPYRMTATNRSVAGFNLVHLFHQEPLFASSIAALLAMAEAGKIRPMIGRTFPFVRAAEAHAFLQSRQSTGKVLLVNEGVPGGPGPDSRGIGPRGGQIGGSFGGTSGT